MGRRYYYWSGKQPQTTRLAKIQNVHPRADRNDEIEILIANDRVGDVRFWYELFAPDLLSVFGWRWHWFCGGWYCSALG
jgi:hypothetical protein